MRKILMLSAALSAVSLAPAALAQSQAMVQPVSGTRLDINVTGEVSRVPDVAIISAGVMTRSNNASTAIGQNAQQMQRVMAALRRAGVAERDIQTSNISLNPEYRYQDNQPPQLMGYTASNQVNVRFRDIADSGRILDALVAQGANQINGPTLTIDNPENARDEARANALAAGRARADLYARALGKRVVRLISVSEGGGSMVRPVEMMAMGARSAEVADTKIVPGEQQVEITLNMSFELQ